MFGPVYHGFMLVSLESKAFGMPADMEVDSEGSQDTMHVDKLSSSLTSPTESIAINHLTSALKRKPKLHASVLLGEENFFTLWKKSTLPMRKTWKTTPFQQISKMRNCPKLRKPRVPIRFEAVEETRGRRACSPSTARTHTIRCQMHGLQAIQICHETS